MTGVPLSVLYAAEPVLILIALTMLLRARERRRFPALFVYLLQRLLSFLALWGLVRVHVILHVSRVTGYKWYFYTYWSLYIAGTVAVFFVIQEMFNSALEPLPGLKRLGSIAFRWISGLSMIAALAVTFNPNLPKYKLLLGASDQLMRCESIFILSLLLFLMLTAGKLGLSYRSRVFGVSFGFGIMAAGNLTVSAFLLNFGSQNITKSSLSILDAGATLLMLAIWSVFFLLREPVRQAIALPLSSPLVRWNEIAMALGHTGGRAAAAAPAGDFFLQDVEKVVDRILTKNSLNVAS